MFKYKTLWNWGSQYNKIYPLSDKTSSGSEYSPQSPLNSFSSPDMQHTSTTHSISTVLTQEMAVLLTKMMQSGETIEPSGYFRCYYSSGMFSTQQAQEIAALLSAKGLFCERIYNEIDCDGSYYLAFNKNQEELHHFLKETFDNYPKNSLKTKI